MIITADLLFVTVVLAAFSFGLRAAVVTIIIVRPLCDRLFELGSFNVAGSAVTYGAVMNIIVLCATILNFGKIQRCAPPALRNIWFPFLLVCAAATLYSPVQIDALRKLTVYISFYSMFALSFMFVKSEHDVVFLLKIVILSSVLPVLYGLFQIFSGIDMPYGSRVLSTFTHPNILAFYLLSIIGIILFLTASRRLPISGRLQRLLHLYIVPVLIVLIMTKTRSAWIGCFVLFLVYGLIHDRRVLAVVLVTPLLALEVPLIHDRISDLASDTDYIGGPAIMLNSYAWRELLWENSLAYIWQRPIFGYGLDSFHFYSRIFFFPDPSGTYAHNIYVQFLFELGLVGLLSLLWIFCRCFVWLIRCWRYDMPGVTIAATIMVVYVLCCYSDNIFEYLSFDWCFWFANGAIFAQFAGYRDHAKKKSNTLFGRPLRAKSLAGFPVSDLGLEADGVG